MPEQNIGLTKDELRTILIVRYRNSDILNPGKVTKETIAALESAGVKFYEPPKVARSAPKKCTGSNYPRCCITHNDAYFNSAG